MGFWRVLYRCVRTVGHLTGGEFTVTGVPLFLFAFLVSSWEMDGKAERGWLGTSPCDNKRTIALRKNALRAYGGNFSELIPPGPRSRLGTVALVVPIKLIRPVGNRTMAELVHAAATRPVSQGREYVRVGYDQRVARNRGGRRWL